MKIYTRTQKNLCVALSVGILLTTNGCVTDADDPDECNKEATDIELENSVSEVRESENKTETEEVVFSDALDNEASNEVSEEEAAFVTDDLSEDVNSINEESTFNVVEHIHKWEPQIQGVPHEEEGHYETQIIQESYVEEIYAWRTFCNRCTEPATGNPLDITGSPVEHVAIVCGGGYYADYVVVETIPHDAVTKEVWIVDKEAWTENVTTGYQCSCGAIK